MTRPAESAKIDAFLEVVTRWPSALVIEGEPGIGKTTLWSAGVRRSAELGFRILTTRPAAAESALAYASLADLLGDVEPAVLEDLPAPQRHAIDLVLLRADGEPTDRRTVAAGFLSVVQRLARRSPVLIAVDDLQWLDDSSAEVLSFAVRRFSDSVGVLCTVRSDPDGGRVASWLQLRDASPVERITLSPLSVGAIHAVITARVGRSFPRRTVLRIQEVSGGNPFYAVELARAVVDGMEVDGPLPGTLSELVRARLADLDADVHHALLAAACASSPTVQLLARATGVTAAEMTRLLENAEVKGIVEIDRESVRFTHPILARGVYAEASPALRRAMHRCMAQAVDEPESTARHLAMAATTGDPETLRSLDDAAGIARLRGAPGAAAELVELAQGLGGDTPERRIRSAGYHLEAGDPGRARATLERTIAGLGSGIVLAAALCLLALVRLTDDSWLEAAGLLERGLNEAGDDLALRVQMLVSLCFARGNAGMLAAAADSADAAVADAEHFGHPALLSQALGMQVMAHVIRGDGLDDEALARALDLEDQTVQVPLPFRPSLQSAVLLAWAGQLDRAHDEMQAVRHGCFERGRRAS